MGITLIVIALLLVAIGALIYSNKFCNNIYVKEAINDLAGLFVFAFSLILITFIWIIILSQNDEKTYNYFISRKAHLEYYLETIDLEENKYNLLYEDINSFNERLKEYKDSYNNLWVNWFYYGKIASIDYIELKYE